MTQPNIPRQSSLVLLCLSCVACWLFSSTGLLFAQLPSKASLHQIVHTEFEGRQLKALITADDANPVGSNVLATKFSLTLYGRSTNDIQLTARAEDCLMTVSEPYLAFSTNRLKLNNASTNLFIEGDGFLWQPGNPMQLTLSNNVHTIVHHDTNAPRANALQIYSDHFHLISQTITNVAAREEQSIATYTGNIRAEDDKIKMTSEWMSIDLASSNSATNANPVKKIVALTNVVILSKTGTNQSRATGQKAVYSVVDGRQLLELSEHPVWRDGQNEGRAETFLLDNTSHTVRLQNKARMRIPRSALSQPGFLTTASTNPLPRTNQPVLISADLMDIELPATNRVNRTMTALNHVTIEADNNFATGDAALFSEATGKLFLTNGTWKGEQFFAKGDLLTIDRTNKIFHAEHHAFLKLAQKSLGDVAVTPAPTTTEKKTTKPEKKPKVSEKQPIEITCDNYDVETNLAIFRIQVRAFFPSTTNSSGVLTCDRLTAQFFSNKVETLIAQGHVDFIETSTTATNMVQKKVKCEELTIKMFPDGKIKLIVAEDNVVAEQSDRDSILKRERTKRISAGSIDIFYSATTNGVEKIIADKKVFLEQDGSWAKGEHAVYMNQKETEMAELTGDPVAVIRPDGKKAENEITASEALIWDLRTSKVRTRGAYKMVPLDQSTNNLDLLKPKP